MPAATTTSRSRSTTRRSWRVSAPCCGSSLSTTPSWTRPELAEWSHQLERRVADQLGQIAKMERLRRFLPPRVADLMMSGGAADPLQSHRRDVTIVFADLRGFTSFAETAEPEEVIAVVREYHAAWANWSSGTRGRSSGSSATACWSSSTIRSRRRITRSARFGWRSNCGSR